MNSLIKEKASDKLKNILEKRLFSVAGDYPHSGKISFQCYKKNKERILPEYSADLHVSISYIIILDDTKSAENDKQDFKIWAQYAIKTVRLNPALVLQADEGAIQREINRQLTDKQKYPDDPFDNMECNHCGQTYTLP